MISAPERTIAATVAAPAGARHAHRRLSGRHIVPALAALALGFLFLLQVSSLWLAPPGWYPAAVNVVLAPGQALTLSRGQLGAPPSDSTAIALRRSRDGAWWISKVNEYRPVPATLLHAGGGRRLGIAHPAAGESLRVGPAVFTVTSAGNSSLAFRDRDHHWLYDGAVLYRDSHAQPACADSGLESRVMSLWNRLVPAALSVARPMSFGGNVHCGNRLGLAGVNGGAAILSRVDGALQLAPGSVDGIPAALALAAADGREVDIRAAEQRLDGASALVLGRTRFELAIAALPQDGSGRLVLRPGRRVALYERPGPDTSALPQLPTQVSWQWERRGLGLHARIADDGTAVSQPVVWLLAGCLAATGLLQLAAVIGTGARQRGAGVAAACTLLVAGLIALGLQRAGHPPGATLSLAMAALALISSLAMPGGATVAGTSAAVLLAAGLGAQLDQGLGGIDTSWLRYYQKSAALLAVGVALGTLVCRLLSQAGAGRRKALPPVLSQRTVEWLLLAFSGIVLLALAAQVAWGDETGVFDLQPVELAKVALTALTSHCLALRLGWHGSDGYPGASLAMRWLRLAAPALLFLALLGVALVQVDDYSPLVLLTVWSSVMLLAYAMAARKRLLAALPVLLALAVIGAIAYLRNAGMGADSPWPSGAAFYGDRFLVWLQPAQHPHTGQQLLLGAQAVGAGCVWGADGMLGTSAAALGQHAGTVLDIPAVQDDFAPTFFIFRHGLAGALLLWGWQAAFVAGLLHTAWRSYMAGSGNRNYRLAWLGRFRGVARCGGAAQVLGPVQRSRGPHQALLPALGQPMSFLSAGGSHLLFFLCPLLTLCALSAPLNASLRAPSY
jgi:cell division protein FtsW